MRRKRIRSGSRSSLRSGVMASVNDDEAEASNRP